MTWKMFTNFVLFVLQLKNFNFKIKEKKEEKFCLLEILFIIEKKKDEFCNIVHEM